MRRMFLNGTAMKGQKDHGAVAGATFVGPARTAPGYRFFAVRDEFPGLFPVAEGGGSIVGELYEMTEEQLIEGLLPEEPAELELGEIELDDGSTVNAMHLVPTRLVDGDKVVDITALGGFRAYQAFLAANDAGTGAVRRTLGLA
jgi:gamma-glutamylcyclotransferase (GGCT)/AIG2-like uncharacterized protein YtfP